MLIPCEKSLDTSFDIHVVTRIPDGILAVSGL